MEGNACTFVGYHFVVLLFSILLSLSKVLVLWNISVVLFTRIYHRTFMRNSSESGQLSLYFGVDKITHPTLEIFLDIDKDRHSE